MGQNQSIDRNIIVRENREWMRVKSRGMRQGG